MKHVISNHLRSINSSPGSLAATAGGLAEKAKPPHKAPAEQKWQATVHVKVVFELVTKSKEEK